MIDRLNSIAGRLRERIMAGAGDTVRWPRYLRTFAGAGIAFYLCAAAFIVIVDPWKALPFSASGPRPMTSITQRLLYPMLVRTGRFDSFVFGNSTGMLIDPERLGQDLGGHFINLASVDGRAWEQLEYLRLVLAEQPQPRTLLFAMDWVWCVPTLDRDEREIRRFPSWLYQDLSWRNLGRVLNKDALFDALAVVTYRLGWYKPIIRSDGYYEFTLPDQRYNLEAALPKIYWPTRRTLPPPIEPPEAVPDAVKSGWTFPLLDWLAQALATLPRSTQVLFVTMPVHMAAQPQPGTAEAQREEACKQRVARIAASRDTVLIDFRIASPVTLTDANYWDRLHYRVPIARKLEQSLAAAARSGKPDPAGFWRVIDAR